MQTKVLLPIGQAALALQLTRGQLRTKVERHEIRGEYIGGILHVEVSNEPTDASASVTQPAA